VTQGTGASRARISNPEFTVRRLNDSGLEQAEQIGKWYDELLNQVRNITPEGRELALVKTHLEQACFYTKRAMSKDPQNQL